MGPEALAQVLRPLADMFPAARYPDVVRGLADPDDAAVVRVSDDLAVVLTADFFPPVVDDPHEFGAIAAANALSDLYAMGSEPLLAINLAAFPEDFDAAVVAAVLRGGAEKVREAGAVLAGGHTTTDPEPKYGLAVLGTVHPERVMAKGGARRGDVLVLTKPIGTGVVTTAHKRGCVDADDLGSAVASMSRLSATSARLLRDTAPGAVHALTDVTGFALAGHAHEMASQSGVGIRFRWDAIPLLPGALGYARDGMMPGGTRRNAAYFGRYLVDADRLEPERAGLFFDPQTSGGLLAAVAPEAIAAIETAFAGEDERLWRVGDVTEGPAGRLEVV